MKARGKIHMVMKVIRGLLGRWKWKGKGEEGGKIRKSNRGAEYDQGKLYGQGERSVLMKALILCNLIYINKKGILLFYLFYHSCNHSFINLCIQKPCKPPNLPTLYQMQR
jgi:hypothetical protein